MRQQQELEDLSQDDQQGIAHMWALFSAAPAKHRNLMLQGLLAQCCFPQLSFLSNSVRELIKIDFLSALPDELGLKILCYLDTLSLCKAAQVSRRWRQLADDEAIWQRMCEQHLDRVCTKCGWGLPSMERKRLRETKRQTQLRATGRGLNTWSPKITPLTESAPTLDSEAVATVSRAEDGQNLGVSVQHAPSTVPQTEGSYFPSRGRPWKDVYRDRFKIGSNWRHGRYSTKVFRGHTNGVMCLQFDDHTLATGSYDATVKIWDIESGRELRTLKGHASGIRCLQFDDRKLISGSLDSTLRIWNWRTGECLRVLYGHRDGIISLHFVGTLMASGSIDHTIRVWNFEDGSQFALRGHTEWVNAVRIDLPSRTIFSASDDLTVRLWDLDTRQTLKIFDKGHVGQVQQVVPLPYDFELDEDAGTDPNETSDDGSSVSPPPVDSNNCSAHAANNASLSTTFEYPAAPSSMTTPPTSPIRPLPPRYMLTSALDSTIRLWNTHTGRCLRTFFGHVEGVWALAADTLRVVSGAEDRMVKVWEARTGRCERTFTGHAGPVTCIGLSDSRIVTGSEDCEVRMLGFGADAGEGGAIS